MLPEAFMLWCAQPIHRLLTTIKFGITGVLQQQRACGRSCKGRGEKADEPVLLWLRPGVSLTLDIAVSDMGWEGFSFGDGVGSAHAMQGMTIGLQGRFRQQIEPDTQLLAQ